MLYIAIFCIFCRFVCLLTIKIFFLAPPPPQKKSEHTTMTNTNIILKVGYIKLQV